MATEIALVFVDNTNVLDLIGLRSEIEDSYLDDAAVEFTIKTKAGVEVTGATWPIAMEYVAASNGNYRGIIPAAVDLVHKAKYIAVIDADGGSERFGHWEFPFQGITRTGVDADS